MIKSVGGCEMRLQYAWDSMQLATIIIVAGEKLLGWGIYINQSNKMPNWPPCFPSCSLVSHSPPSSQCEPLKCKSNHDTSKWKTLQWLPNASGINPSF